MIVGFEGGLGSGKTVGGVRYIKMDSDIGKPILSNIDLFNIEYEPIDMSVMLDNEYKSIDLFNVSILIDEVTVFADCRLSSTKHNRVFSYFILQTRKNSVTLYYTTQDFGMIDLRLYKHTHFYIICEMIFPDEEPELAIRFGIDQEYKCIKDIRRYVILDMRNRIKPIRTELIIKISDYYNYYDTDQKIQPLIKATK